MVVRSVDVEIGNLTYSYIDTEGEILIKNDLNGYELILDSDYFDMFVDSLVKYKELRGKECK